MLLSGIGGEKIFFEPGDTIILSDIGGSLVLDEEIARQRKVSEWNMRFRTIALYQKGLSDIFREKGYEVQVGFTLDSVYIISVNPSRHEGFTKYTLRSKIRRLTHELKEEIRADAIRGDVCYW